ncbi:MAG: VaFE repeat-containing surface-anchored protein, partial [Clostridiales bacterium]|nr:VaFE repeat-containing surface-anchored protein [Clostridiales bacterium]
MSSVVARNDHETVSINLVKTSTQPDLIANRQFTVAYHGNGTAPNSTGVTVATLTTNAAGKASLSDLPVGWYSITEKNNDPDIKLTVTWQYGTEVTYGDAVMLHATVTSPDLTAAYTLNVKNERPTVQTEATDAASGSQQPTLTREVTITDTVSYENFIPGRTYKVIGTLMDRTAKTELLDENGDPITAEKVFTASATGSGTVEVVFPSVKIELLRGKTIVVFEDSYDTADNLIVSHHRFEDYPQTLFFPEIGTTLIDRSTQDHIASTDETAELVDVIAYDNLLPGHYVAVGTLMNKQTQNAVTDENG